MAEIRKGLIVTNSTQQIKTFTDDISSNVNLNLGSGYNTSGSTTYPIQFSHLTSTDGEQKAVTINNGLVGIDTTIPKAKLHIGKEYFGKDSILASYNPASVINEHTSSSTTGNHNYYKIAQISNQGTICYGGLNIKGTIIGKQDLNPTTSGFASNFMRFDITIMVNHANTGTGSPNLYMIGTVNGSAMNSDYDNNATTPTSTETDIIVSKLSGSNYPMGVLLCIHKESVCNIEITSTAYNNSDINCFTIDYDGVRKPTNILLAYSTWESDCLLQLSDPNKNDIIYNTPHGVGINQNNPFTTFAVKGNMVIGSGTGYNVGDYQQSVLAGVNINGFIQDSTATFANGLLVEGNVGIGTNKLYTNTKLHIKDTTTAFNLTLQNDNHSNLLDGQETNIRFHNYKNATIAMIQARKHGVDGATAGTTDTEHSNGDLAFLTNNNSGHTNTPTQKMIIKNDGKVGIGTNYPKSKLDVEGSVRIGSTYSGNSSITTDPANGMIVEGNVGIGTNSPTEKLDVNGNIDITGSGVLKMDGVELISNNGDADPADFYYNCRVIRNETGGPDAGMYINYGSLGSTADPADCRFYAGGTNQRMIIKASGGNVGIGTSTPNASYKLDVAGNVIVTGSQITLNSSDAAQNFCYFTGGDTTTVFQGQGETRLTAQNGPIAFHANTTNNNHERMRITSDGILKGNSDGHLSDTYFRINHTNYSIPNGVEDQIRLRQDGDVYITSTSSSGKGIRFYNGTSEAMRITEGNVGIGTIGPKTKLQIDSTDALRIPVGTTSQRPINTNLLAGQIRYNTTNSQFEGYGPGNSWGSLGGVINVAQNTKIIASSPSADSTNNQLMFFTATTDSTNIADATERMRIDANGNVGIGTTNPLEKLTVTTGTNYDGFSLRNEDSNILAKIARRTNENESYFILYDGGLTGVASKKVELTSFGDSFFNAGNVGIGTTSPATALQISSTSGLRLTNTAVKLNTNDRIGYIEFENGTTGAAIESCVNEGGASNNADLRFMTSLDYNNKYVERMRIDKHGNVGIGTASPTAKLHIANEGTTVNEFTALRLSNLGGSHLSARSIFDFVVQDIVTGSDPDLGQRKMSIRFKAGYDGIVGDDGNTSSWPETDMMMFDGNNDSVGIGTTAPIGKLQVFGDKGLTISGNIDASNHRTAVLRLGSPYLENNDAYCAKITSFNNHGSSYASDLRFYTHDNERTNVGNNPGVAAAKERMSISSNGNVGIGTTTPSATLHIVRPNGTTGTTTNLDKSALQVYKSYNGGANDIYTARIYGTDASIGETGIRICEKGANSLTSNSTKVLDVYSNGSSKMVVTGAGNVGIGLVNDTTYNPNASPKETLHVKGSILVEAVAYAGDQDQPYLIVGSNRHTEGNADTTNWGRFGFQHRLKNGESATNTRITVDSTSGEVYSMNQAGDVTATSYNATSDIRHKENVHDLENPLEKIKAIRGVNFNFKNDDKIHSGIIAQEVAEIIPEAICKNDDEKWTANYNTFIGYLIESVKTLSKENDELKEDIKRKGDVIVKLHNDVSSIKEMLKIRN